VFGLSGQDRRAARREATIEEILAVATEVMAIEGPGALSLAEVSRRVGMRPPSLYQYFPSKLALYDEVFARGARELADVLHAVAEACSGIDALRAGVHAFVGWSVSHPVPAQILFWRPVPGFTPSERAYQAAVEVYTLVGATLRGCVEAGQLAAAAATERGLDLLTTLISGAVSQQLANEPQVQDDTGRFTKLAAELLEMFIVHFAPREGTNHA
jgi:AcrR family transcriptional regulator